MAPEAGQPLFTPIKRHGSRRCSQAPQSRDGCFSAEAKCDRLIAMSRTRSSIFLAAGFSAALAAWPLLAQQVEKDPEGPGAGWSLMEEGARLMLRGLMSEMEPALRDLEPAFRELQGIIGDLGVYHAPEILPNGDIILRRRVPLRPGPGDDDAPGNALPPPAGGEIDL